MSFFGGFGKRTQRTPPTPAPLTAEALDRVRALVAQRKNVQAIKVVREETGMDLAPAKDVVDALKARRPLPAEVAPAHGLAERVRELPGQDRIADAVRLVATETGMTEAEAARFIDALD